MMNTILSVPSRSIRAAIAGGLALVLLLSALGGVAAAADEVVTGIEFETVPSPAKIYIDDETIALRANAKIQGATSPKDVTLDAVWSSSNTSAIKVDKGVLTAVSTGTSTIRAQYKGYTVSVQIFSEYKYDRVTLKSSGVELGETADVELGDLLQYTLTATKDTTDTDVTKLAAWSSSSESIATVSEGKIKLLTIGETTITAKYKGRTDKIKIKVTSPYKKLFLVPNKLMEFKIGDAAQAISASGEQKSGAIADLTSKVEWTSANVEVATVKEGVITPVAAGTTTIKADYLGVSDSLTVVVRPPFEAMRMTPDQDQHVLLKDKDKPIQFKVEVMNDPEHPIDVTTTAKWTSDNPFAATVSDLGLVSPKGIGKTTIKAEYKGLVRQITMVIYPSVTKLEAAQDKIEAFIDANVSLPKITATTLSNEKTDISDLVTWTTNDSSILTKEDDNWVAKKVGIATLQATIDGKSVSVQVTVSEKPLVLVAEVSDMSLVIGKDTPLPKVKVTYESGNEADVSNLVTWKSSSNNVFVKSPIARGLVKSNATLTASYLGKTTTVRVTVEEEITKIFVEAPSVLLNPGRSKSIKVTGVYKSGKSVSLGAKMNWSIAPETLAVVNGSSIKALTEGTGIITGSYQGKPVQITLIVKQKLKRLTASDSSLTLAIGGTGAIKLTGEYEDGKTIDATSGAVWTSSKSSVVSVKNGTVTAMAKGTASIKATFEGKSVTVRVTVK